MAPQKPWFWGCQSAPQTPWFWGCRRVLGCRLAPQKPWFLGCDDWHPRHRGFWDWHPRTVVQKPLFLGCRLAPQTVGVASTNMHFWSTNQYPKTLSYVQEGTESGPPSSSAPRPDPPRSRPIRPVGPDVGPLPSIWVDTDKSEGCFPVSGGRTIRYC